jgi:membrane protein implicated in regulation of membrane protease activity
MLVANVWHWWIGIALFLVSVLIVVALAAGYLKSVSAKKYPSRKQARARHSDL